jgi:peptidoglycan/xylan/chitin deacetylase (PgdA/CDA1 family)
MSFTMSASMKRLLLLLLLTTPLFSQQVALTFDDLPAHGPLPPGVTRVDIANSIIKTLNDAHVPEPYGFINAQKLEKIPEDIQVLKLWRAAGFPLGNHTFTHMSLTDNTADAFEQDIAANEPILRSLMPHADWHWFRYPFLWEGDTLEKRHAVRSYLRAHDYKIAQVTLDFGDYAFNAPYARCMEKKDTASVDHLKALYLAAATENIALYQKMAVLIFGHDIKHIMLLHIGAFETVMLPHLIDMLKKQNFTFITLPDAASDPAYKNDPDLPLKWGGIFIEQMRQVRHLEYPPHTDQPPKELETICQ